MFQTNTLRSFTKPNHSCTSCVLTCLLVDPLRVFARNDLLLGLSHCWWFSCCLMLCCFRCSRCCVVFVIRSYIFGWSHSSPVELKTTYMEPRLNRPYMSATEPTIHVRTGGARLAPGDYRQSANVCWMCFVRKMLIRTAESPYGRSLQYVRLDLSRIII